MKTTNGILKQTAVAACVLVVSSASLLAANPAKPSAERGTIKEVDANHHQLVVSDHRDKANHRFQWNDQTQFMEHGKKVTASALGAGESVRLTYAPSGDIPVVQKVQIAPAKMGRHASANPHGTSKS